MTWIKLRRSHPKTVVALTTIAAAMLLADVAAGSQFVRYRREVTRLRAGMTDGERRRADLALASEQHRMRVVLELVRRQARGDRELHLAVAVDSGRMYLEREGVVLREMSVRVGPERVVGSPPDTVRLAPPRGARTITGILSARDAWDVPPWVFEEQGTPVPADRAIRGALGSNAIVLSGGALIYAAPDAGPLASASYLLPGAIVVSRADLAAIAPNLTPGLSVYFY